MAASPIKVTGSRDFSGGVNSAKVPTIASDLNPNGLGRSQLAWLTNGTMRDGILSPRDGWQKLGTIISKTALSALLGLQFQGSYDYTPANGTPYKIMVIGGHVIKIDPSFQTPPVDLSANAGLFFTGTTTKAYFCQAGIYLVIQSGNYNPATKSGDLPFIWNGQTLYRSNGITGVTQLGPITARVISVNFAQAWIIPSVGNSIQVFLTVPYQGNQYDVLTLVVSSASSGANPGATIGTFRVINVVQGGFVLETLSLLNSGISQAGVVIHTSDSPCNCTFTIFAATNPQTTALQFTAMSTVASQTNGNKTINFTNASYLYPGSVNDVIIIDKVGTGYFGPFTVTGIAPGQITLGSALVNSTGSALTFMQQQGGGSNFNYVPVPTQPGVLNLTSLYPGSIGDTFSLSDSFGRTYGTMQVTGFGNPTGDVNTGFPLQFITQTNPSGGEVNYLGTLTITITNAATGSGTLINQIPSAKAMAYYMGRIWYATGKTANAGDIVGGPSGTLANNYQDSVLSVTENPLVLGGDGFTMPSGSDDITGFSIPQMINASLGQGLLNIGTANAIFALQVPVTRADWIAANAANAPELFVVQLSNGFVNDWSCVGVNGDIWFRSLTPDIRSLLTAVRYFEQWGNVDISSNENRIFDAENRTLLTWASGIYFSNRLWMTAMPKQTPYGVVFPALIPLDFEPISTMEEQLPPNWEGNAEGLEVLNLTTSTFNGVQRAFAVVLSTQVNGQIELWEMVPNSVGDNGNRIKWQASLPSFTWAENSLELSLKRLVSGEMWIDDIEGVVDIKIEYIPDGSSCRYEWYKFSVCSATDSSQIGSAAYPPIIFQPGIRRPIVFPLPPDANANETGRPANIAFEVQPIITVHGNCSIRGFFLKSEGVDRPLYEGLDSQ